MVQLNPVKTNDDVIVVLCSFTMKMLEKNYHLISLIISLIWPQVSGTVIRFPIDLVSPTLQDFGKDIMLLKKSITFPESQGHTLWSKEVIDKNVCTTHSINGSKQWMK